MPAHAPAMATAELTEFARRRIGTLLEQWWRVAPAPDGLLQPTHGPAWEPSPDRRRSLVSQSRFAHNFATGWRLTGDERWREATRLAVRGLMRGFPVAPCGLPVFCVNESGTIEDNRVWPYGVAFALFGLAQGAAVDDDPAIPARAEEWWQALIKLRDGCGGWTRHYSPTGQPEPSLRTHNPIMHLFEALLAWHRRGSDARWGERAAEVLAFIRSRVLNPGGAWIPEYSDDDWQPAMLTGMDVISIGHQWEWAHLIVQAREAGIAGADLGLARTLAGTARRLGLKAPDHVVTRVRYNGSILADRHAYWDYCEAARACVWLTARGGAPEHFPLLPGLMRGLETRCYDPINRGYVTCGGQPPTTAPKGQLWRVDYHQIAFFADLIDLAADLPV